MIYAGNRLYGTIGPSRSVATADGRLYLLSHGRIHEFGPDGMRRGSMDLAGVFAPTRPSDFDRHADGRIVLTDPDAPQLVRCAWPAGPCERIVVDVKSLPIQEVLPLNAAKLHVDDPGRRYFVSDNSGHRVLVTDHGGKLLSSTPQRLLKHPNQLALASPDRLAVVDTDHMRILTLSVEGGQLGTTVSEVSTRARGIVRPGRAWPFDAALMPDGTTAVLIAAMAMRDADVVFFDTNGKPARRAALPDEADPFDIEHWRGNVWVADATHYRFLGVRPDGSLAPPLEDTEFLAELEAEHRAADRWRQSRGIAQVGIVVIPLLGALLLRQLGEPKAAPVPSPVRRGSGKAPPVEWIELQPAFTRRVRLISHAIAWLCLVSLVAWCAAFMIVFRHYVFSVGGIAILLPTLGWVVATAIVTFVAYRFIPRRFSDTRLGISRDALHFSVRAGGLTGMKLRTGAVSWADVYGDGLRLLGGNQLVLLEIPFLGRLFDESSLKAVTDRIAPDHMLSRLALTRLALRKGAFPLWPLFVGLGAAVVVLLIELPRLL